LLRFTSFHSAKLQPSGIDEKIKTGGALFFATETLLKVLKPDNP